MISVFDRIKNVACNEQFLFCPTMFSTHSDNRFPICLCFLTLYLLIVAELEEPKIGVSDKGLTHSDTITPFDAPPLGNKPFENTVGKGEIARNEQFLLFPPCFLLVWIAFSHFRQI